jgi:AraC-like DNA-binding protein
MVQTGPVDEEEPDVQPAPERLIIRASDLAEARVRMASVFGEVQLRSDEQGRTDLAMQTVRSRDLMAVKWSVAGVAGGSLDRPESSEPAILTGVRLSGGFRMWSRWTDVDTNRPFLYPDLFDASFDRPTMANLSISRAVVAERARALTGDDACSLRFTGTAPVDPAYDGIWRDTVVWVARTMDALSDRPAVELAHAGLVDVVASLMLRAFPNTTLESAYRGDLGGPRTSALRRAMRYIDDHLDSPVTVVDIAGAARLSTRGVYAAFRRELEMSPMEYLRRSRLSAVRGQLLESDPHTLVEDVAIRWGFVHAGRFETLYRETYGEAPADTLRR